MAQNSGRTQWTFEEVDAKLYDIMSIYEMFAEEIAKEFGHEGNLALWVPTSAGFLKVAGRYVSSRYCLINSLT